MDIQKHNEVLMQKVKEADEEIAHCKKAFSNARLLLMKAETKLIEAREAKITADEELRVFQNTKLGENSLADERDQQIAEYKEKMPELLKSIENEHPIPYKSITELDVLEKWPNAR